jgi:tetratricopeptide (TPR) repeat protein
MAGLSIPSIAGLPTDGEPIAIGTYRTLHSDVLGEDRQLLVSLPEGYTSDSMSYPVVFVLYGDQVRGYFAEAVHVVDRLSEEGSIPRLIVLGVANTDRYRDLSPVARGERDSGIEPFSQFVANELIPYVESEYRTKDFRILVGPQAGAEFGMYALAHHPVLFDALIIGNPFRSLPVRDLLLEGLVSRARDGFGTPKFLQIACPDAEGGIDKAMEVGYVRDFEAQFGEPNVGGLNLVVRYVVENRDFIPSLLVKEGLRELFHDYAFPSDLEVDQLTDLGEYYSMVSAQLGFDVDIPERVLAAKSDVLSQAGSVDAAMEMLEYMLEVYPASVDGHWRLGNLCRELGERERALEHYRECVRLMPNMWPAMQWIDRLDEGR